MDFEKCVEYFRNRYLHDSFDYSIEDKLCTVAKAAKVPTKPGVYMIYGLKRNRKLKLLYIGRAGTIKRNGQFKGQMLLDRITKGKQCKTSRPAFFRNRMEEGKYNSLRFYWFVVHEKKHKIIPALAEAELIQAYYESNNGRLPPWNCVF